jgi:hypothetical protein
MVKRKHTLILGYALTQTGQGVRGEVIAASQIRQQHKMVCILNPIVSVLQQMSSLCSVSCGKKVEMKTTSTDCDITRESPERKYDWMARMAEHDLGKLAQLKHIRPPKAQQESSTVSINKSQSSLEFSDLIH